MTGRERFDNYLKNLKQVDRHPSWVSGDKVYLPNTDEFYVQLECTETLYKVNLCSSRVKAPLLVLAKVKRVGRNENLSFPIAVKLLGIFIDNTTGHLCVGYDVFCVSQCHTHKVFFRDLHTMEAMCGVAQGHTREEAEQKYMILLCSCDNRFRRV